ncbi:MAG: hypothetical protein DAHOPDDO_02482 [Ignavibacteriaceae bacterium]|nr:hypothetical protein [Ignavibacteriota bacterium]MBV6421208.1 hypothetical protein [Ignavibacteriaceae bacterium]MCE7855090.1 hypothetical protein [Ignavibacteria bacterium CHB3]GJQ42660.1 MAG: hypothetical protein JETCAE03_21580 [Ignavibacteriaceae bacterium]
MPSSQLELNLEIYSEEGWTPVIAVDNLTRAVIKNYIDSRLFEADVNAGMQFQTNTCISLVSSVEDGATFEVVDGFASPCLKNKDTRFVP